MPMFIALGLIMFLSLGFGLEARDGATEDSFVSPFPHLQCRQVDSLTSHGGIGASSSLWYTFNDTIIIKLVKAPRITIDIR